MKFASSMRLNWQQGIVEIDGITFPFYVSEDIDVDPGGSSGITSVGMRIFVDGVVLIQDSKGERRVIDSELGDVGQWARELVRKCLLEAHPWLSLPEGDS